MIIEDVEIKDKTGNKGYQKIAVKPIGKTDKTDVTTKDAETVRKHV